MRVLTTLVLAALMFAPAAAQSFSYPVVQLQSTVRQAGTFERDANGVMWLRTTAGSRYLVGSSLNYYDASNAPLVYTSLQPGNQVTVEYPSGETRVIALQGDTVTLLSSRGISQMSVALLPVSATSETMVEVRYPDGKLMTRTLGEAVRLAADNKAVVVLPDPSYATLMTPKGPVSVNLMPYMTFSGGITEYGTVQKKETLAGTDEVYVLTGRGENLAVPVEWINNGEARFADLKAGDRVSVDIPKDTTVQLREMFGKSAQFRTREGKLLQLPFAVVPEDVLTATTVGVRRLNGDIEELNLRAALAGDQSRAHMILLPGVPGVSYVMAASGGVYLLDVR